MGKVARFTQKTIDTYVKEGYWTDDLTVDFWEKNASVYPDDEAIVDSRFRLTWSEAVRIIHRLTARFLELGWKS